MPAPGPHAMPAPFVWNESFKVNYEKIDQQHKLLFQALFDIAEGNLPRDVAYALGVFTKHFYDEEEMMRLADYENTEEHKQIHKKFMDGMKDWESPVAGSTIALAMDWLVNHIKIEDFKYKGKLLASAV